MEWIGELERVMGGSITCLRKMFSRRNSVYLVRALRPNRIPRSYVVKISTGGSAVEEAYLLTFLRAGGVNVPRVIWHNHWIIVLEYIDGVLLADLLEQEQDGPHDWVEALAAWLWSLHSLVRTDNGCCFCMPDLNLRNFIYKDGRFFGYDFQETVFDRPERDLGGLCAFIMNNDPMFADYKYDIAKRLIGSYASLQDGSHFGESLDMDRIHRCFFSEMRSAMERRKNKGNHRRTNF